MFKDSALPSVWRLPVLFFISLVTISTFLHSFQKHKTSVSQLPYSALMTCDETLLLFGGRNGWHSKDWTASDDRVRGGKSQSYLDCGSTVAKFHGNLNITALGGAGFASQRTTGEDRRWDLSAYDGIELVVKTTHSDEKNYTFILKDEILAANPENGREQATISWEYDFAIKADGVRSSEDTEYTTIFIPWKEFVPTYRGKKKDTTEPIDLKHVRRISIMMRSFFGTQQGHFHLSLIHIAASKSASQNTVGNKLDASQISAAGPASASSLAATMSVNMTNAPPTRAWFPWSWFQPSS